MNDSSTPPAVPTHRRPTPAVPGAKPSIPARQASKLTDASSGEDSSFAPTQSPPLEPGSSSAATSLSRQAEPIFRLLAHAQNSAAPADLGNLQARLIGEVKEFKRRARVLDLSDDAIKQAAYVLCSFIDDIISQTPWGGQGIWMHRHSLQYSEQAELAAKAQAGGMFFDLLGHVLEAPRKNRQILELMYTCLCLGYQGTCRGEDNGGARLANWRHEAYERLRELNGRADRTLSGDLSPMLSKVVQAVIGIPLWFTVLLCSCLLVGAYVFAQQRLQETSTQLAARIGRIKAPPIEITLPVAAPVPLRLSALFQAEIDARLLTVEDADTHARITILGDGLFDSGSDTVTPAYLPLLQRIAAVLGKADGNVFVSGHTDNRQVHAGRFSSNEDLSAARADAVRKLLIPQVPPSRITGEGFGDRQPVAVNTTPEGRSKNRRVEIIFYPAPASPSVSTRP